MARIQFSVENRGDLATLSGGSWQPSLPLANLQQTDLSVPARSVDALLASTRVDVDFGNTTTLVRLVGVMKHNLGTAALYRITGGTVAGGSDLYDSGWLDVWPRIYSFADLDFEEPNWWTGQISDADAALYPIKLLHDLGGNYLVRYWRIEFDDTANADGYAEFSRLWMGPIWSPTIGYAWGAKLGWEPRDRAVETRSGRRYGERLPSRRLFSLTFDQLTDAEAYGRAIDMQRRLGSEGEVVVIPDPDDTGQRHRRDILARIKQADGVAEAFLDIQQAGFVMEELL